MAHFFRRAFDLLRDGGAFGLIATNTIGQGDTRETGLAEILKAGGTITRAVKRYQWPNESAAVIVSIVHVAKGVWPIQFDDRQFYNEGATLNRVGGAILNNRLVSRISAYLVPGDLDGTPARLVSNAGVAFNGTKIYGQGFLFADNDDETTPLSEMKRLKEFNPSYERFIKPYIGGEDVNTSPTHSSSRWVINLTNLSLEQAEEVADLLAIVRRKVLPERMKTKDNADGRILKRDWWKFFRPKSELYEAIRRNGGAILIPETSPHLNVLPFTGDAVFSHALKVIALPGLAPFAILQSRVHEIWARFFSSSMKDDLRYAPSDCFETFPFPSGYQSNAALEGAGQAYRSHRAELMMAANEGMTNTYNHFHDVEERGAAIQRLRDLHNEMDRAVLLAYGWDDLAETLRPQFLTLETEDNHTFQNRYFWPADQRDLVLSRLLVLNSERHGEEVAAGMAPASAPPRIADDDEDEGQNNLDLD